MTPEALDTVRAKLESAIICINGNTAIAAIGFINESLALLPSPDASDPRDELVGLAWKPIADYTPAAYAGYSPIVLLGWFQHGGGGYPEYGVLA